MRKNFSKRFYIYPARIGPRNGLNDNDIELSDNCDLSLSYISNDGAGCFDCHPQYKCSLFVNTARPDRMNTFKVWDFEVFGIDYGHPYNINKLCKYPDIIMKYVETNDISEESLKQFDDDTELLNDLNVIYCEDSTIRFKLSHYYFENPSDLLLNTQIVDKQNDRYLKKWTGNYKWKLLYRASEHGYTPESFHEYCDDKGPTLIIVKSSGGWIFGGYTTKSWSGHGIYII